MSKAYKTKLYVLSESNLYKVLGVPEDADLALISKSYKTIAKELHPDLNQGISPEEKSEAGKIFQKITSAFNTLKDAEERRKYDAELKFERIREESLNKPTSKPEDKSTESKTTEIKTAQNKDGKNPDGSISFTFKQMRFVDLEKAKEEKEKADKEKATEKFNNAKKLIENKKFDEAVEVLRVLTDSYPNEAKYHSHLGLAMEGKGWGGYAQAEFKVALHYDANDEIAKKYYKPASTPPRVIKKEDKQVIDSVEKLDNISNIKDTTANLKDILGRVRGLFGKK